MNRDAGWLLTPLLALALFALVAFQTVQALEASGAWSGALHRDVGRPSTPAAADPFAPIGALLLQPQPPLPAAGIRDPFTLGGAPSAVATRVPAVRKPKPAAPPARPVLTAIVWDADPRAVLRWEGRDWTVHTGGLFDEFQVVGITRDQVTLSRNGETFVLQRKPQGD